MMSIFRYLGGLLIITLCNSCVATSGMGTAVVSTVDSLPCFSVPQNSETKGGVPLYALGVTKMNAPGVSGYPKEVWYFRIAPPGNTVLTRPDQCIRYGSLPVSAQQEEFEQLESNQVYYVYMQAVPEKSNLQGYKAGFCMKPQGDGSRKVVVIPWDQVKKKWQYDLCAKP